MPEDRRRPQCEERRGGPSLAPRAGAVMSALLLLRTLKVRKSNSSVPSPQTWEEGHHKSTSGPHASPPREESIAHTLPRTLSHRSQDLSPALEKASPSASLLCLPLTANVMKHQGFITCPVRDRDREAEWLETAGHQSPSPSAKKQSTALRSLEGRGGLAAAPVSPSLEEARHHGALGSWMRQQWDGMITLHLCVLLCFNIQE